MGIKATSADPRSALHPNNMGQAGFIYNAASSLPWYVAPIALNNAAVVAGAFLTLIIPRCPGTGQSVKVTPTGAMTAVFEIKGTNQFGANIVERVSFAASGTGVFTFNAFKTVSSVQVISRTAAASTIQFGIENAAGNRLGLPIIVRPFLIPVATALPTGEFKALIDILGVPATFAADVPPILSYFAEGGTIALNAAPAVGPMYCIYELLSLGFRY
jgi:hypothetical protein